MSDQRSCFQCGKPIEALTLDEEAIASGWFTCEHCGERIVSVADAIRQVKDEEEQRVRRALGVDQFKPSLG